MPSNENSYWKTVKNTLGTLDNWTPELFDVAKSLHLAEGAVVGFATAGAMKRGKVATRYLLPSLGPPFHAVATFGTNATAGLAATTLTSYCLTTERDKQWLTNRIVHAPLMPLQSASADLFCDGVIKAYSNAENNEMSPEMRKFAENCQLRRDYEDKLRKEKGMDPNEPINIPFMGVPTNALLEEGVLDTKARYFVLSSMDGIEFIGQDNKEEFRLFVDVFLEYFGNKVPWMMGLATFLFLRKVPRRLFTRLHPYLASASLGNQRPKYILDPPPTAKANVLFRTIKLGFDVCASLYVVASFPDMQDYHHGKFPRLLVESPLVAGRSTLSEHACADVVQEYKHMQASLSKSEHQSLRHLSALVHNCQRRQEEEQAVREKRGLAEDALVLIPPPGVSNGITLNAIDKAWAESLVTDRGEMDTSSLKGDNGEQLSPSAQQHSAKDTAEQQPNE